MKVEKKKHWLWAAAIFFGMFLAMGVLLYKSPPINMDSTAGIAVSFFHYQLLTSITEFISIVFEILPVLAAVVLIAILMWRRRERLFATVFIAAMLLTAASVYISKELVSRVRPAPQILAEPGFSFPSGHVASAIVLFGLLTIFYWASEKAWYKRFIAALAYVALILVIAFSRLYLNVHWLTDILGSVLLGGFWLFLVLAILEKSKSDKRFRKRYFPFSGRT